MRLAPEQKAATLWALARLALAGLVAGALSARVPAGDPLRSTILMLPGVVWAFDLLANAAAGAGGPRFGRRLLLVGAGGWLLLALGRGHLGLAGADGVVMALYFGLALLAVARLAPALRRRLGHDLPLRPHLVFFLLPLLFYVAILPWSQQQRPPDGDEPYYLLLGHSLAHDFDTDLGNDYREEHWRAFLARPIEPQPGDPLGTSGEVYSRHSAFLPLLLVPLYRPFGLFGAGLAMCLMTASLAWFFLRLAARYVPQRAGAALLAWLLFAFGPPLVLYSAQIWIEVPAALLLALALDRLSALSKLGGLANLEAARKRDLIVFGLALALLPLLKIRLLLLVLPLLLLAAWRGRLGGRRAAQLGTGLAVVVLALFAYNWAAFGNPFKMYGRGDFELLASPPGDYLRGLIGIFFDCAFGLFACAPAWMLLAPGSVAAFFERRRVLAEIALIAAPYTLAFAPRLEWYGGWAPPFRYPLVLLPLFGLLLVFALDRRQQVVRAAWAGLGLLTFVLTLVWLVQPGFTYNTADGVNHLLQWAGNRLDADLGRLLPSTVRPRLATGLWVLGTLAALALFRWLQLPPRWPRGGTLARRDRAALAGVVGLLGVLALLVATAENAPTRRAEIEDGWVKKTGGTVDPDQWVTQRPAFRGGWRLQPGDAAQVPAVAAGPRLALSIEAMNPNLQAEEIQILAGELELARVSVPPGGEWGELVAGPFEWQDGYLLVLRNAGGGAVVVDAVELSWD